METGEYCAGSMSLMIVTNLSGLCKIVCVRRNPWRIELRGSTCIAKEVAKLRTTTDEPLLLKKVCRNRKSKARRREMKSRASWGMSESTSIIKECQGLKHSGAATLQKLKTTTARTVFCWRESDKIKGARSSSPSIERLGSRKALPSLLNAFELHHSGTSVEVNPEGKNRSKVAFFSIFSKIQRSSFIGSPANS